MEESKKRNLWIVCGIPGIGKSTWIKTKHNFKGSTKIISRDDIRFSLLKEDEPYFSHEKEVWIKFIEEAKASLKVNDNTIMDATHLNQPSRTKVLRALGESLKDVRVNAIVFIGDVEVALERNSKREGRAKVPETAILNMAAQMTCPQEEEGFDTIYIITVEK